MVTQQPRSEHRIWNGAQAQDAVLSEKLSAQPITTLPVAKAPHACFINRQNDGFHRPEPLRSVTPRGRTMKNLFAIVGVIVVAKKGYEFFREYMEMKQELEKKSG